MSRRTKQDYIEVLRRLLSAVDDPLVEWVMMDFEAALWQAVREVLPGVVTKGCVFHWTQRVYRKISILGLSRSYMEKKDKFLFMRKVMSLPFLPHEHIRGAFDELQRVAETSEVQPLIDLMTYIRTYWVNGSVWRISDWSVFRETVRTNNDVEGWHRRINGKAGRADLSFYVLVPLLLAEAETVDLQVRLVPENLLNKLQRQVHQKTHGKLFDLWDQYEEDEITTSKLLRACSAISGLGPTTTRVEDYEL